MADRFDPEAIWQNQRDTADLAMGVRDQLRLLSMDLSADRATGAAGYQRAAYIARVRAQAMSVLLGGPQPPTFFG